LRPVESRGITRPNDRRALGRLGERLAASHLETEGYRILDSNVRVRRYEIDLIVERDGMVCFVEVKTRSRGPQTAAESLGASQMRRMRRAAESWIHSNPGIGREFRFDLVSVDVPDSGPPRIVHIERAFVGDDVG